MSLKREHSVPSDATPARKVLRLTAIHVPSSPPPVPTAPTIASPSDTEHIPTPPNGVVVHLPEPVTESHSLEGLGPAQLASRLEALTERYNQGVDEVEAQVIQLRRQVSVARRYLETSSSLEEADAKRGAELLLTLHDTPPRWGRRSEDAAADDAHKWDKERADEEDKRDAKSPHSRGIGEARVDREGEEEEQSVMASRICGTGDTMHCREGEEKEWVDGDWGRSGGTSGEDSATAERAQR